MSRETKSVEADSETGTSVLELWRKWYDIPAIAILAVFMLWTRLQSFDNFVRNGEVFFSGNDAYYHYRNIEYVTRNWPWTMASDPWTKFPFSTSADHFGTLYDQMVGTVALVVGFGSPDAQTVGMVTLVAPAVFGALVAVPVYYLGQRLGGRPGGIFGVLVLALLGGTFFRRTLVGFADHHAAEVFFQATAVVAVTTAIGVAERELPVYEQVLDRDWEGLRKTATFSALAGVAVGLYIWAWPPGVVLVGILGIYFVIALSVDYVRGRSPEHVASVGVVSMLVTVGMLAVKFDNFGFSMTSISIPHFAVAFGVAGGCVFMTALARGWDTQDLDERLYPVAVGALVVAGVGAMAVVAPRLLSLIESNLARVVLFGQTDNALTVAEVQSPVPQGEGITLSQQIRAIARFMYAEYGMAYVTAYLGLVWMVAHLYLREYRSEDVFLIVYTVFITLMALTQSRFNYYLVISIAAFNAWVFGRVVDVVGIPSVTDSLGDIEVYQVLTVLALLAVVVAPMAPPLAAENRVEASQNGQPIDVVTAGGTTQNGGYASPSGVRWSESADWMQNNTPEEGNYGGAGNADQLEYYGSYPRTDDFAYPEGAYGVMAWWDYGHWITVQAERIPVANPFQQNPRAASAFFQAQNESQAELILETLPVMEDRTNEYDDLSQSELREIAEGMPDQQAAEDTRYVMIDDQTAAEKFYAVAQWSGPGSREDSNPQREYMRTGRFRSGDRNFTASTYNRRYENTMLYNLYFEDASGLSHYRLVHERNRYGIVGGVYSAQTQRSRALQSFTPRSEAFRSWTQDTANVSRQLATSRAFRQGVPLGQAGNRLLYNAHVESTLKTYERVPGATLTGTVEDATENTTVTVALELETSTGRTFNYVQEAEVEEDGSFSITVPYATNDEVSPEEGGTDSAVEATGEYDLFITGEDRPVRATNFSVPESAIYDEEGTIDLGTVERPGNESGAVRLPSDRPADGEDVDAPAIAPSRSTVTVAPEPAG